MVQVTDSAWILCCCGCGIGWQPCSNLTPSLGTSICHGCGPKKTKINKGIQKTKPKENENATETVQPTKPKMFSPGPSLHRKSLSILRRLSGRPVGEGGSHNWQDLRSFLVIRPLSPPQSCLHLREDKTLKWFVKSSLGLATCLQSRVRISGRLLPHLLSGV